MKTILSVLAVSLFTNVASAQFCFFFCGDRSVSAEQRVYSFLGSASRSPIELQGHLRDRTQCSIDFWPGVAPEVYKVGIYVPSSTVAVAQFQSNTTQNKQTRANANSITINGTTSGEPAQLQILRNEEHLQVTVIEGSRSATCIVIR